MKKLLFPLAVSVLLSSACSPLFYQQIATLSSETVSLKDNGSFSYEDGVMTIEYDFWSEAGEFSFVVNNNSDDNIYLNLAESYFVNNGFAKDYFQSRTYEYADKDVSVKVAEKEVVCIPAHSYKVFEEFNVSSTPFRECGFPRDPSKKENAVREYTGYDSPRVIENRLTFKIGEVTIPVTNIFYVSEYLNVVSSVTVENIKVEKCDGSKRTVSVNKYSGNNKYYIIYTSSDLSTREGVENDRTTKSFRKSFTDGLYKK